MKKKKLFSCLALAILAAYLISMLLTYSIVSKNQYFKYDIFLKTHQYVTTNNEPFTNKYSTPDELKLKCMFDELVSDYWSPSGRASYPSYSAIFDEQGNIVSEIGSYIHMFLKTDSNSESIYKEVYVPIEQYLTEDIKTNLANYYKSYNKIVVESFDYILDDDINYPVIPQKMVLTDGKNEHKFTIQFSDKEATEHYKMEENSNPVLVYWYNVNEEKYRKKSYAELYKNAHSDEMLSKVKEQIQNERSGGQWGQKYSVLMYTGTYDNGQSYCILKTTARRPFFDTIYSGDFKNYAYNCTVMFTILCIISFVIANKFYKKNKQLEISRNAFTNAAAHELKTPLAVISNQCECIMENVSPNKNMQYVNSIYDETKRMTSLVMTLLHYNRISSLDSIEKKSCNLSNLLETELEKYQPLIETKHIKLNKNLTDVTVKCNSDLIALVIDNFLSNAVKHAKEDGIIEISVSNKHRTCRISIFNEGEQISKEDGKHIWEELYRADKARTSNSNSTGMGLSLCKKILELHHFKYGYQNQTNGVTFFFYTKK